MADEKYVSDFKKRAEETLGKIVEEYVNSGSGEGITLRENVEAFKRIRLRPRMLRDVTNRDLSTSLLGHPVAVPIGISPSAFHGLFCLEGETATTRGARRIGCCYIMSSGATKSVEEIAKATLDSLKWFQKFIHKDRDITKNNIRRAADAGFKALVFTTDAPVSKKPHPVIHQADLDTPMWPPVDGKSFAADAVDSSVTWEDILWLKNESGLPVVVKGVLTAEDTELAIQHGADAVYVSNHGGRQLDTVQATIHVLPEVVAAAKGRVEIYLDGGIRMGTDVLKALALGARAVFVGRPVIWGLACNGQQGVEMVLSLLTNELSRAMAVTGCCSLDKINSGLVAHAPRL